MALFEGAVHLVVPVYEDLASANADFAGVAVAHRNYAKSAGEPEQDHATRHDGGQPARQLPARTFVIPFHTDRTSSRRQSLQFASLCGTCALRVNRCANADRARRPATALRGHRCACTALRVGRRPPLRGSRVRREGAWLCSQGSRPGLPTHAPTGLQAPRGGSLARSPHPLLP